MLGVVHLFNFAGQWLYNFTAPNGLAHDQFGVAVASYGTVAVVGCGTGYSGVLRQIVYVFDLESKAELVILHRKILMKHQLHEFSIIIQ